MRLKTKISLSQIAVFAIVALLVGITMSVALVFHGFSLEERRAGESSVLNDRRYYHVSSLLFGVFDSVEKRPRLFWDTAKRLSKEKQLFIVCDYETGDIDDSLSNITSDYSIDESVYRGHKMRYELRHKQMFVDGSVLVTDEAVSISAVHFKFYPKREVAVGVVFLDDEPLVKCSVDFLSCLDLTFTLYVFLGGVICCVIGLFIQSRLNTKYLFGPMQKLFTAVTAEKDEERVVPDVVLSNDDLSIVSYVVNEMTAQIQGERVGRRRAETFQRIIFDHVHDAVLLHDLSGEIHDINQRVVSMFSIRPDECSAYNFYQDFCDESTAYEVRKNGAYVFGGRSKLFECSLRRPGRGEVFPAEIYLARVEREGTELLLASIKDLTEQKHVQSELKESEQAVRRKLEELVKPGQEDGVVDFEFEDIFNAADLFEIQDNFARSFGVSSIIRNLDGKPLTEVSNPMSVCSIFDSSGHALCPRTLSQCKEVVDSFGCVIDGMLLASVPVTIGGKHVANWSIGGVIDEDVAGRVLCHSFRRAGFNERQMQAILKSARRMSSVEFAKVREMLSSFAEVISELAFNNILQARAITQRVEAEKRQELANQQLEHANESLKTSELELQVQAQELKSSNTQLAEQQSQIEEAYKYKSEFFANMSHELRTPLNSIILLSSLLVKNKKGHLEIDDVQKAAVINRAGNELLRIINDILDYSKAEAGHMAVNLTSFSLGELLRGGLSYFETVAEEKGVKLLFKEVSDKAIVSDYDKISQVVRNLLSNAVKFTDSGDVTLTVEYFDDAELPVVISVRDSGIGIPADKLGTVFEAFKQVDGTSSRRYQGTGLGLSICRQFVELLGGAISVESILGEGSCFTLALPYKAGDMALDDSGGLLIESSDELVNDNADDVVNEVYRQEEDVDELVSDIIATPVVHDRSEGGLFDGLRILVVDDDIKNIFVISSVLEMEGAVVFDADNGESAIDIMSRETVDVVLMDIMMPVMDGYTAIEKIRSGDVDLGENSSSVPIIVVTANYESGEGARCLDLGANHWLSKPVDHDLLVNAVVKWGVSDEVSSN